MDRRVAQAIHLPRSASELHLNAALSFSPRGCDESGLEIPDWQASGMVVGMDVSNQETRPITLHVQPPKALEMTQKKSKPIPRRGFLRLFFALPASIVLFRHMAAGDPDEIVEVDGWILKRSDLS
jgi:hypothetical protein